MVENVQHFLQEIDESLRVEKFEQFWKHYGKWVIAGCVGIVLSTMVSVLWKNHLHEEHTKQTDLLIRAEMLAAAGKASEAAALFEDAEKDTHSLATLAKLRRAEMLTDTGETDKALALYREIADSGADDALRSLARRNASIIAANKVLAGKMPKDQPTDVEAHSAFGSTLSELTALRLLKAGKNKEAKEKLNDLLQNDALPKSERLRVLEILDTIPEDKK
jgi:hypothetical protein